ncbi:two-component system sensor histidine kinase/response regulator fusion protein [Arcobacter acticola]|jgi:two-component system, sensor histidine kinase and response regulator|uniref:Two-component system sensor histidine kinase/response regulator fusion protein n=1 Tax=Arcobacter acticola TaxID=1849015 RepID=A0A6M8EXK9_9BACT|nr:response regulator [Arcobacter acticola]QKE29285.1 two-component system sensor histidine kinase/response regulator fusion protein [Arcobacter acticola]
MYKKYDNKILLVDDDTKNLQVAMNILKNYNVIYAQNGEKAFELLEKNNFDLILLDVVMPMMDGYNVCSKIKENEKTKNIPIVFLTVKDDEQDIVKGFELGAVDYITKPFYSEVLLKRVEVHLKIARLMSELKHVNSNLNKTVKEQVEQIRQKDEIIVQQSKISAMASIIDVITIQWKKPLDKIKLYLQSLNIKIENIEDLKSDETFKNTLFEINKLDEIMNDFHKSFNNHKNKENVNLKVSLDNALFLLKDKMKELDININIQGDILLSINIVFDEIKHIFSKLLNKSMINFKENSSLNNKFINISFEEINESIFITYEDNAKIYENIQIDRFFLTPSSLLQDDFDLGFYLVKVFIEKNFGLISIEKTNDGIKYIIRFDK